jgi:NAD(P)-dependent dehydrogenase (short-subunit alcohol dehydrogenase family)
MNQQKKEARTIVITGGGAGIGRATALFCAARGDRIAIFDIDAGTAQQVAGEALRAGADGALGVACDVSAEEQVEKAFDQVAAKLGEPWGLFANAAVGHRGMIHELPLETWNRVMEVNLTGVFLTCKHGLQHMIKGGKGGSIVCTSSPTGFVALAAGGAAPYSATKGAISTLVRCMAVDYAQYGIRVNALVPGSTETKLMWGDKPQAEIEETRELIAREVPAGRLAQPEEPARAAVWLMSDESVYVTGSHLVCDGGILAKASVSK